MIADIGEPRPVTWTDMARQMAEQATQLGAALARANIAEATIKKAAARLASLRLGKGMDRGPVGRALQEAIDLLDPKPKLEIRAEHLVGRPVGQEKRQPLYDCPLCPNANFREEDGSAAAHRAMHEAGLRSEEPGGC